ncbi:hypothetical protein [Mechercharimyces sp. CAU 1602]|uniref:hypothetical protein n=1 Tax=Mechercharimyces sp. CAU 1602 TaxID=2973933 RepID=UPI00216126E2|nr:hypothetical protein [Mechercharimyces sp. CAU 1602]MCS1350388.1 hypothetical protein [Mechercharimyces sp. CAU 1602]
MKKRPIVELARDPDPRSDILRKPIFQLNADINKKQKNVSFTIEKDVSTQYSSRRRSYMIHKNTLAQILYEAFYNGFTTKYIFPTLIMLDPTLVSGFNHSGIYTFYVHDEYFHFIKNIENEEESDLSLFKHTYDIHSDLAIGYALMLPSSTPDWNHIRTELDEIVLRVTHLLQLHGGLDEKYLITAFHLDSQPDYFLSPIIASHWFKESVGL